MSRWKELPDSLDQRVRQLVVQLRRLKDRSGSSLDALAVKTGHSRSSWDRYLNGKALPPRHAVEALARVAGADPLRLLVLHEVAEKAWPQRIASSSSAGAEDGGEQGAQGEAAAERSGAAEDPAASAERSEALREEPGALAQGPGTLEEGPELLGAGQPSGIRQPAALAAVVAAALVGMAAGMLIAAPWGVNDGGGTKVRTAQDGPRPSSSSTSTGASTGSNSNNTSTEGLGWYVFEPGKSYPCKVRRNGTAGEGLFAGYSATRSAVLAGPGWDVVEAQCLLGHHQLEPGIVDGVYGQQTIAAVMRLQKKAGLPADGVVGPHTWQVLRG
ncbi:helix-turn-helix domain-containing protein [Streptomyces sp. AC555_RSS877]|uniref:helix-turn-helix domain-containing protein n=1 Tax=Streptomyces sp. AC555_RSS877 TaxID=2823688 RepID=UPI001C261527|nr:helix-turn-helix domain-containing protein [Streptomyces sp. AC555_RSS877]